MNSEEIYDIVLKNKAIPDIAELYNIIVINSVELNHSKTVEKYFKLLKNNFGLDNKFTIKAMH